MRHKGSLILCYHRVAEGVNDPFQLCVTPANFAAQLDEIARHGEPSTLGELSIPSRRPRVVVTFDDGYVDNLTNATPIAEARGIPITIFVTSGVLGADTGFWWDRLGTLLRVRPSRTREIRLPTKEGTVRVGLGSSKAGEDLQSVRQHLLPLPVAEIHHVLDAVAEEWGTSAAPPPDARSLTPSELGQLAPLEGGHYRRSHGRPRAPQGSTDAGPAGNHLVLEKRAGEIERSADLALCLPLWGPGQLRRLHRRCGALSGIRNGLLHHPGQCRAHVGPVPPAAAHVHELGSTSLQSGLAALETRPPGADRRRSPQRTMSPLRVAMVTSRYSPHQGGVETHVNEVARRMAARGLDVTVLTTDLQGELPPLEHGEG